MNQAIVPVSRTCPFCGSLTVIHVGMAQYYRFCMGEHAQDVFPELSATDREIIITGMCEACQKTMDDAEERNS